MSRYSTSAKKVGSTHVALGFLIGFVSFDFGLTTVSSCFLICLVRPRRRISSASKVQNAVGGNPGVFYMDLLAHLFQVR